jgi:hypothetical protein
LKRPSFIKYHDCLYLLLPRPDLPRLTLCNSPIAVKRAWGEVADAFVSLRPLLLIGYRDVDVLEMNRNRSQRKGRHRLGKLSCLGA